MKKIVFLVWFGLMAFVGSGQTVEVSLGYGAPSLYGVGDTFINAIGSKLTGYSTSSNGVLHLEVTTYNQNQKWRYGGEANIEFFSTEGKMTSNTYYSVGPKLDYFWSSSEHALRFYSGLSVGALIRSAEYRDEDNIKTSSDDVFFAFNITPLGLRYGRQYGVYLESNIGSRAFLQLGFSYLF